MTQSLSPNSNELTLPGHKILETPNQNSIVLHPPKPTEDGKRRHAYDKLFSIDTSQMADFEEKQVFRFRAKLINSDARRRTEDVIVSLFVFEGEPDEKPKPDEALHRLKLSLSDTYHTFSFQLNLSSLHSENVITLYSFISTSDSIWEIGDVEVISLTRTAKFLIKDKSFLLAKVEETDLEPKWEQRGNQLIVTYLNHDFMMSVPAGYNFSKVSKRRFEAANIMLFDKLNYLAFGSPRSLIDKKYRNKSYTDPVNPSASSKIILSYSTGEDSTAALALLPSETTVPVYIERDYESYRMNSGFLIVLGSRLQEKHALSMVPDAVRITSTFELIGVSVGFSLGFRDSYGYGGVCLLLSDHFNAETIAFGSVMEQVYMKSGNNFTDVPNYVSSSYNRYRDLFEYSKTFFCLATGYISEVVTNKICNDVSDTLHAVPCPDTNDSGEPCGVCFKCFRKTRLEGNYIAEPKETVARMLKKRPLKSATSVVFSAQKDGYFKHGLDEYRDLDLSFLTRYFDKGLYDLVPENIANRIRDRLIELGISPMSVEEEEKLRDVAMVFDPKSYSKDRSRPKRFRSV